MIKNLRRFITWVTLVSLILYLPLLSLAQDLSDQAQAAKVTPDLLKVLINQNAAPQAPIDGFSVNDRTKLQIIDNKIAIEAIANDGNGSALLLQLQELGLSQGVAVKGMVSGYLPIEQIANLKNITNLTFARSAFKPATHTGSVTSQGDKAIKADVARSTYNVTGAGTKVGILSDSYNNLGGAAAGVASDDLPAAGVQVLMDNPFSSSANAGTDEGRAMAELVHDVAPGAAIAFNTANGGQSTFAQGIINLAANGCKVIVDDVIYFFEPYFQDGVIAQAIDQVVNGGATYFTAAGNEARASYQKAYTPNSTTIAYGTRSGTPHIFSGSDIRQTITVPARGEIFLIFQWDTPFASVSGAPGAQTDMDLVVYAGGTYQSTFSGITNNIGGDGVEYIDLINNGTSAASIEISLVKRSGPDPTIVKYISYGSNLTIEYDTKSGTSIGHTNSNLGIGVGAAPYFNTPPLNSTLTTAIIEPFSSAGGTPILLNTNGTRINGSIGITRQQPKITSVDGGNTTFFYSDDSDDDSYPNFYGTSAAAPHAAAVAALMKEKVPAITPATILSTLQSTALDMDDPFTAGFDTGFDFGTGYGFIQADRALQAIVPSSLSLTVSANPTVILTTGTTTLSATVSGGTTPYSYTFSGPGTITPSGNTATVSNLMAGVQTFTVLAKDATSPTSQSISGTVSVTVNMAPPGNTPPTVANPVPPQSATVGVGYTLSLANVFTDAETPSQLTLSVSGLPAGLNFVAPSTISGTPSMSGVSSVIVTATDPGSLTGSTSFMLTVSPAAGTPPPMGGSFAIVGVSNVSCATVSVGQRTLTFTPQYSGLNGMPVSFSVANEMLPTTAPGPYSLRLYTDNPVITLKAVQSGTAGEASFVYNWLVACNGGTPPPPPPTTGTFSITGVTTVSCATVTAGERMLTFNPQYAGVNGQPISFSVANEMLPTTAPGPYSLRVYTDNPVITLKAVQSGIEASFAYNWIVACSGGSPGSVRVGAEAVAQLKATLLPNPVGEEFGVRLEGMQGQSVRLELRDVSGHSVLSRLVEVSTDDHQERLRFGESGVGLYFLRVSTGQQALTLKVIRE